MISKFVFHICDKVVVCVLKYCDGSVMNNSIGAYPFCPVFSSANINNSLILEYSLTSKASSQNLTLVLFGY